MTLLERVDLLKNYSHFRREAEDCEYHGHWRRAVVAWETAVDYEIQLARGRHAKERLAYCRKRVWYAS